MGVRMGVQALKKAVFDQVDPSARQEGLSVTNRLVIALILIAVASAVIETEPTISGGREQFFRTLEIGFSVVFLAEYLVRLWVADMSPACAGSRWPRLKFVTSPSAIIDLIAIVPPMLAVAGGGTMALRFVRFFRILRLAKLGRFSRAWTDLADAIKARRDELFIAFSLAGFVMLIASTSMPSETGWPWKLPPLTSMPPSLKTSGLSVAALISTASCWRAKATPSRAAPWTCGMQRSE